MSTMPTTPPMAAECTPDDVANTHNIRNEDITVRKPSDISVDDLESGASEGSKGTFDLFDHRNSFPSFRSVQRDSSTHN